ncbi:MAG TPA: hypothetical protein VFP86_15990 [bacterium]|nr:hypothetical protein [bacterium]
MDTSSRILAHIRHAEEWLRKARADYARGDGRQVLLRLLLAEAEIRRARESGGVTAGIPRRRAAAPGWAILGALAAAGVVMAGYALVKPPAFGPVATSPTVVRAVPVAAGHNGVLRFESGQVLPFVGVPAGIRPGGPTGPGSVEGVLGDPQLNSIDGPALVTFR